MKKLVLLLVIFFSFYEINAQSFAEFNKSTNVLTLENGIVKRVIEIGNNNKGIVTSSYSLLNEKEEFLNKWGENEFSFILNGNIVTGNDSWENISIDIINNPDKSSGAVVILERKDMGIQIAITYLLYPALPVIRKKITFKNIGSSEQKIEALDIERLSLLEAYTGMDCWIMNDYARQRSLGQFVSTAYDPVNVVHQINKHRGIVLGNEAPGMMKRTTVFYKRQGEVSIGLTHPNQIFPFSKYLNVSELWESTWVFTGLYANNDNPNIALNGFVNDFIRKHLGTRIVSIPKKPGFVYNTWLPFMHNINEKLIYELVDAAAECGIEEFVIDDGWQNNYGDWKVDKTKFPNGLKPVFDYIKSKGMKPGLWISVAAAMPKSNVYKNHPEWLVRKADGKPINLQNDYDKMYFGIENWDSETHSMCMTTGWCNYIKNVIVDMVKDYGLEYIKADFATVTGAYTLDKTRSGCHATNHSHEDRSESLLEMYQSTWKLFDDLHQAAPNLFIDCTYETMGGFQLIDLDMCKHAEGNWLSNFHEPSPLGAFRVRQMAWWRTPVIPAGSLVIGNMLIDDPEFELSLKSLAGTFPIALGDPRKLSATQRTRLKSWANWLRNMQDKYNYMIFRQDLPGFGEPTEGNWDGFQRINTENKSGGIVGVFRQNDKDKFRNVRVQMLDTNATYEVFLAPEGTKITRTTGKTLAEKGFKVELTKDCDGNLYEIRKIK
jgi:alpha-galactosidase